VSAPNSTISRPLPSAAGQGGIEIHALAAACSDHDVVKTFEADGAMLHDLRDVVGADINVRPCDDEQHTRWRAFRPAARASRMVTQCLRNRPATAPVKAALGKQVVELYPETPARNIRNWRWTCAVAVGERLRRCRFGAAATFADEAIEIVGARRTNVQALSVVG